MKNFKALYIFLFLSAVLISGKSYGQYVPVRCGGSTDLGIDCVQPGYKTTYVLADISDEGDYIKNYQITGVNSSDYTVSVCGVSESNCDQNDLSTAKSGSTEAYTVPESPYKEIEIRWNSGALGKTATVYIYMASNSGTCYSSTKTHKVEIKSSCGGTGCSPPLDIESSFTATPDEMDYLMNEPGYSNTLYCSDGCLYDGSCSTSSTSNTSQTSENMTVAAAAPSYECGATYYVRRTYFDPSENMNKSCWIKVTIDCIVYASKESQRLLTVSISSDTPNPLCDGGTVTLSTPTGRDEYIWSGGSGTSPTPNTYKVTVSSTTKIYLTVKDYQCTGVIESSGSYTIDVRPTVMPSVVISASKTSICEGETVRLTASSTNVINKSYSWSNGATSSYIDVTPDITDGSSTKNFSYTVTLTTPDKCVTSSIVSASKSIAVKLNKTPTVSISATKHSICSGETVRLTAIASSLTDKSFRWSTGATTSYIDVSPANTSSYSVELSTNDECVTSNEVTASKTITVMPIQTPGVNISGPSAPICAGETVTLTAVPLNVTNATYRWSNGSTTSSIDISPTSDTQYSVDLTTADECVTPNTATASSMVEVTPNKTLSVTIQGPSEPLCDGETTILTAIPSDNISNVTYQWNDITDPANVVVLGTMPEQTATTGIIYEVVLTTTDNCVTSSNASASFEVQKKEISEPSIQVSEIKETSFDVTWSAVEGATDYTVNLNGVDDAISQSQSTETTTMSFSGLIGNHQYTVTVIAHLEVCDITEIQSSVTVLTLPPVVSFTFIHITSLGGLSFEVIWNLTPDYTERITTSEVEVLKNGEPFLNDLGIMGTSHHFSLPDVLNNYTLFIRQVNASGPSGNSQPYFINLGGYLNSIETKSFDENGEVVGHSKEYFDLAGKPLQSQTMNFTENAVLASVPLYDEFGRLVGNTLPSTIGLEGIGFRGGILLNEEGEIYNFENIKNLDPVGTQRNTIGGYYSANNTDEDNVPATGYPYSQKDYYTDGSGGVRRAAGPGETHRLGSGHESWSGTFSVANELEEYLSIRNTHVFPTLTGQPTTLQGEAVVSAGRDSDGKFSIAVSDRSEQTLMTAMVGSKTNIVNNHSRTNALADDKLSRFIYFYLLQARTISVSGTSNYEIENIITDAPLGKPSSLPAGFYRVVVGEGETATLTYDHDFGDVSYNYYDNAGRLVCSISPNGVEQLRAGVSYANIDKTTYIYNHQGWLLSSTEPDAGTTNYKYRTDGSIRFSQNAEQEKTGRFSYTDYDNLGRPIESGEYVGTLIFGSALEELLDNKGSNNWADADKKDWVRTYYDTSDDAFQGVTGFSKKQDFVMGAVSWTENENVKTWYSYDEQGRVTWMAQKPTLLERVFVASYQYNFLGNVLQVAFRSYTTSGQPQEQFYHYYLYDADQRLTEVYTSLDGSIPHADLSTHNSAQKQAKYTYYLHGPLKRIELGGDLQGIDFVYNINGWLKQINHPSLDSQNDPGGDGSNGFMPDAFGMILNYYENNMNGLFDVVSLVPKNSPGAVHGLPGFENEPLIELAALFPQIRPTRDPGLQESGLRKYSADNPAYGEMLQRLKTSEGENEGGE